MTKNYEIVQEAFGLFLEAGAPFAARTLAEKFGEEWWEKGIIETKIPESQKREMESDNLKTFADSLDMQRCLSVFSFQWKVFQETKMFPKKYFGYFTVISDCRNEIAHMKLNQDLSDGDTDEVLKMLYSICELIDDSYAKRLKNIHEQYRNKFSSLAILSKDEIMEEKIPTNNVSMKGEPDKISAPKIIIEPLQSVDTELNSRLSKYFDGKIVRKDLTNKIRQGANVPTYVLEYLLGQYCTSHDDVAVAEGVETVKNILSKNFVRPDEAQKILSQLREHGGHTVIDKLEVILNTKTDTYEAYFSNLGIKNIPISSEYVTEFDRLLCGGIWCIVRLEYNFVEEERLRSPISIKELIPIQMPHVDMDEVRKGRAAFTKDEWMKIMLRSTGMEPDRFTERERWLLLTRMIPLVENNYNLCELGPRSTGKSHIYKEISPNSILVSGGQTTVANLFYSMTTKTIGLVGLWDCVAFDEVAGIKFKDNDGVQIMKDYMASGSFARGKEEKAAKASMVFVGNINQSVDVLLKSSHLFDPFPPVMGNDTAFLDRMHCYLPGWEIPKFRPESFTNDYGFITDYLAEFVRELRKDQCTDVLDKYFKLGRDLNQRDTIAVRKTVSGLVKLLYPDGSYKKENIAEIVTLALEMRRRVKEQLKKIGGMEFYDVNFSYIDNDTFEEHYVSPPEQGGGKLIPEGQCGPGQLYSVSRGKNRMIGVYRLETQILPGGGKLTSTGIGTDREAKEAVSTAFNYLKANGGSISKAVSTTTKDYIVNYQDLHGHGMTKSLALPTLIAICSIALNKQPISGLVILGEITVAGSIIKIDELANTLQTCLDAGAKKVLIPITSAIDLAQVPPELVGAFSLIFYNTPQEAVFKALGVD